MHMRRTTFLVIALCLMGAPANAQRASGYQLPNGPRPAYGTPHYNYLNQCYDEKRAVDDRIAFCRGMIGTGRGPDFDAQMQVWIGTIYARAGRYDDAIAQYDEAAKLRPNDPRAFNSRCWIRASHGRDLDRATADCDRAIWLEPANPDYVDSRGMVAYRLGQFDAALKSYNEALVLYAKQTEPNPNPRSTPSLFMRGVVEHRLGNTTDGDKDIAAALASDPLVRLKYQDYGITPAGDIAPAAPVLTPALMSEAHNPRKLCFDPKQDAELRAGFCKLAMKSGDDSYNAGLEVAIAAIYTEVGKPEQALEAYGRALKLDSNNQDALTGRCKGYALMGKELDAAVHDCNAAVKYDPQNTDAWDGLAVVEYRLGHMDAALNDCNAAMGKTFRRRPFTLYMRGVVEYRLGNKQAGDENIQAAVSLDPAIRDVYAKYGIAP